MEANLENLQFGDITLEVYYFSSVNGYLITRDDDNRINDNTGIMAWPGSKILGNYLLRFPDIVRNKHVCDFGCGCGISGLLSLQLGALSVAFYDMNEKCLQLVDMSARRGGWSNEVFNTKNFNWLDHSHSPNGTSFDILIASDVFYSDISFEVMLGFFLSARALTRNSIIVSFINRDQFRTALRFSTASCICGFEMKVLDNDQDKDFYVLEFFHSQLEQVLVSIPAQVTKEWMFEICTIFIRDVDVIFPNMHTILFQPIITEEFVFPFNESEDI